MPGANESELGYRKNTKNTKLTDEGKQQQQQQQQQKQNKEKTNELFSSKTACPLGCVEVCPFREQQRAAEIERREEGTS